MDVTAPGDDATGPGPPATSEAEFIETVSASSTAGSQTRLRLFRPAASAAEH